MLGSFVRVVIPQIAGRAERGAQSEIWIGLLRAPPHRLRAERSRNPHRRMRFLVRQRPRIHMPVMEMLALVAPRPRLGPRLHDKIVRLLEVFAVVRRIRVVEKLFAARASY